MDEPRSTSGQGARSRSRILKAAADASTEVGLDGLSIAGLAAEVGLSKSGVAAHFASKEALQLAAIAEAARGYDEEVLAPRRTVEPGRPRLERLMSAWIDHIEALPYRGGCFFAAAGHELAARSGPVRDEVARCTRHWIDALEAEATLAVRLRELSPNLDVRLFVFRLHALVQEANLRRQLLDDEGAFDDARVLWAEQLAAARVETGSVTHDGTV